MAMSTSALPYDPARDDSHERILRYTFIERVIHWIAGLAYVYVLGTGLGLLVSVFVLDRRFRWGRTHGALLASMVRSALVRRRHVDVCCVAAGYAYHAGGPRVGEAGRPLHP